MSRAVPQPWTITVAAWLPLAKVVPFIVEGTAI
jgi:hypothetical protein